MDEGRLAVVFRQEEHHRKFVHMMNDIIRSRLSLYSNCLAREQHESSVKLVKNCAEMRRSIVRQKVLKKCLEMRKRKIISRDPTRPFGQYGGKPLWAMSRDIDRVIADNHPRVRRAKRVDETMRQSLETGAILDQTTVSRRMEAFFQLKQARQQKEKVPEPSEEVFKTPARRRNFFKPPSWVENSPKDTTQENTTSENKNENSEEKRKNVRDTEQSSTNEMEGKDHKNHSESLGIANNISLDVDSKGRLRGIKTNQVDRIEEEEEERDSEKQKEKESRKRNEPKTMARIRKTPPEILVVGEEGKTGDRKPKNQQYSEDRNVNKPRSKLILPPIESSKNLVSRT